VKLWLVVVVVITAGCTSPEAERTRGGGPGADIGNRGSPVVMHEGSKPYEKTPRLIAVEAPPLDAAAQARRLSLP
jgi:hypothetical protein